MLLNKLFDCNYVINLDRRRDRMKKFEVEAERIGLTNYNRISAVDGHTLNNNGFMNNGALGLLRTNKYIIAEAKERGYSSVLIMEDDVKFTDEVNNIDELFKNVPNDWDFIYFGSNNTPQPPIVLNQHILKLQYSFATQCVAIKNTIYDKILNLISEERYPIDVYYAMLHRQVNAYGFVKNIAIQSTGYSDIEEKNVNYDSFMG